jgi:hypothetical protein
MTKSVATLRRTMPDLRAAVVRRMKERKMSTYALIKSLKGKRPGGKDVPASTVYEFVRGGSPINSADLGLIMDVLDMHVGGSR